jgi:uncharacterized protein YecT (DUF1311 family)
MMKRGEMMRVFICLGLLLAAFDVSAIECKSEGNQLELNQCALDDFEKADRALNETYQTLIKQMQDDKTYIDALREAQRAWIRFRDAELKAMFSCDEEDVRVCWGSMYNLLYLNAKTELTQARAKRLQRFIEHGRNVWVE